MAAKNEFEAFEQFSFVKQFEANHAAASSEQFRSSIDLGDFRSTEANKRRYRSLKQSGAKWFRPKAEAAAKSLEMPFLYTFGYDYSSCHIHPMANDGQDYLFEFQGVENFHPSTVNLIIQNSILVQVLLIQEGLNASELRWRKIVYDFLDECLHALAGREQKHQDILSKLVAAGPDFDWGALPRDGERHG